MGDSLKEKAPKWMRGLLENDKKIKLIVIIGMAGILLICLSQMLKPNSSKPDAGHTQSVSAENYAKEVEQRLLEVIRKIDGVGEVSMMVTLESGVENVYANEEKKNTDKTEDMENGERTKLQERDQYEQNYILVDGDDGKEALIKTQLQPKVKGVVVVCAGGEQAAVQQRVIDAVTVALDIDSSRVCVTKLVN